jgi:hypothetical protein|tara:strand:+ start:18000 stop:18626 length:627 start_codon:yes stop_codon:yes gene_type:complete
MTMGIDDREYMHERYRERGGARSLPIWRERHARLEFDDADMIPGRYTRRRFSGDGSIPGETRSRPKKNLVAAAGLAAIALVYTVIAAPFGAFFSGLPKNGEFRVRAELQDAETATLTFTADTEPVALHLLDRNDREVFVGFIRAEKTAKLKVPAGTWHTIVTSGTRESLNSASGLDHGRPLGMIKLAAGSALKISPSPSTKAAKGREQ